MVAASTSACSTSRDSESLNSSVFVVEVRGSSPHIIHIFSRSLSRVYVGVAAAIPARLKALPN